MLFRKFEVFIAHKFNGGRKRTRKTRPVIQISIAAIAVSTAVMILTAAVVNGFKREITEKVIGFGAHIDVGHYSNQQYYERIPIEKSSEIEAMSGQDNIDHVQAYVSKPGILKNNSTIQANILKGVGPEYRWDFFEQHLKSGSLDSGLIGGILISSKTAAELNANVNDRILLYFIQDPPRVRKLTIRGIYQSGFGQFDDLISFVDIGLLQKMNGWNETQYGGYELLVKDFDRLEETASEVYASVPASLDAQSIYEQFPDIFNWLELQDMNYLIIISLMIMVAAINSVSSLIIMILEKTQAIGVLKTIGANNWSIKRIFILQGAYLLLSGLFWGNLIGLGLGYIQHKFGIIELNVESYYLSSVPILLSLKDLLIINGGAFVLCMLALILPSHLVSNIVIAKVIKFD
ncbi:MAG: FtsX-like permease family protein [Vicingaceae bacterium]